MSLATLRANNSFKPSPLRGLGAKPAPLGRAVLIQALDHLESHLDRKDFFIEHRTSEVLRDAIAKLTRHHADDASQKKLIEHLTPVLRMMLNNAAAFDEHCSQNIEWIGGYFLQELANLQSPEPNAHQDQNDAFNYSLERIFSTTFRFVKELQFSVPGELSIELNRFVNYANDHFRFFSEDTKQDLSYANYVMPAQIIKQMLHSAEIKSFLDFQKKTETAREMKDRWDAEIEEKSGKLTEFSEKLKNLATDYNFVGLHRGFESIYSEKQKELNSARNILISLGALALIPLLFQIAIFYLQHDFFTSRVKELIYIAPAFVAVEILLIYFFRIALQNFTSIRLQILQLKLRMTLCQFIQSYADYSTDIKKKDSSALERFESIIFSQIAPDEGTLPSTFDGVDQIAKLVQTVKGR